MTILQILISVIVGAAAGFGTNALAPADSAVVFSLAAGLVATGLSLGFFARRNNRPARIKSITGGGIAAVSRTRLKHTGTPPIVRRDVAGSTAAASAPPHQPRVLNGNFKIAVDTVDGAGKVTVTVKGLSGNDWKTRVRPAIERVSSVKWEFPKNLGDGVRQITGTIRGGNPNAVVTEIRSATARFGG